MTIVMESYRSPCYPKQAIINYSLSILAWSLLIVAALVRGVNSLSSSLNREKVINDLSGLAGHYHL